MKFYPIEAKKLIGSHEWHIPQNHQSKLFHLMISEVIWV